MDLAYWGFRRWPFERSLAADRFFASPVHDEAMARLLFLVEECRRTGVLIGPAGTGKTYLFKLLQQRAERMGRLTVRADATGLDGHELISEIAAGFHVPCDPDATSARIWNGIQKRFAALSVIQQPVVIAIDHLDLVDFRCQQVVARLRQLADAIGGKLTIILAIRNPIIPAAVQDIVELRMDISPWDLSETAQFIQWSIEKAGSESRIFLDDAVGLIHQTTNGVPANIVTLCNLALLAASARDEKLVSRKTVEAAHRELMPWSGDHIVRQKSDDDHVVMPTLTT